jgi:acetolactate synthase I/II/III large subunit
VRDSDLVMAVGNSLNAISTSRWNLDLPAKILQVDVDPCRIGINYPDRTIGIAGDARAVTLQLLDILAPTPVSDDIAQGRAQRLAELQAIKSDWRERVASTAMSEAPMSPIALITALRAETPDDCVLAVDAGNPGVWSHLWEVRGPGHYLKPVGFGNMGFALPAAIGAKVVRPDLPVVALLGDGSLGMTMGELETVVREDLPICIVVMNDLGYGNIRQEELLYYGPRYIGVDFVDVDYAQIARGFGIASHRADSGHECAAAVRTVLASGRPGLIDARIDPSVSAWTDPLLTSMTV